jgi:hypothetical protein
MKSPWIKSRLDKIASCRNNNRFLLILSLDSFLVTLFPSLSRQSLHIVVALLSSYRLIGSAVIFSFEAVPHLKSFVFPTNFWPILQLSAQERRIWQDLSRGPGKGPVKIEDPILRIPLLASKVK